MNRYSTSPPSDTMCRDFLSGDLDSHAISELEVRLRQSPELAESLLRDASLFEVLQDWPGGESNVAKGPTRRLDHLRGTRRIATLGWFAAACALVIAVLSLPKSRDSLDDDPTLELAQAWLEQTTISDDSEKLVVAPESEKWMVEDAVAEGAEESSLDWIFIAVAIEEEADIDG